jgi:hydrogenase/urease accessory protein HupE
VAAMLAVGIWAVLMRNRSIAALLGATVAGIVAGTLLSACLDIRTIAEQIIVVSVIVIGVFATTAGQARVPRWPPRWLLYSASFTAMYTRSRHRASSRNWHSQVDF